MQMDINSHPITYHNRKAVLSLAHDVTEQLRTQNELKKSEEKHRALVENVNEAITLINESGQVIYRSPCVERINGYTFGDVKGLAILDIIHREEHQEANELLSEVYACPGMALSGQFRMLHKEGHYIWIDVTLTNLFIYKVLKRWLSIILTLPFAKKQN